MITPSEMSPLEVAVGFPFGELGQPERLPRNGTADPIVALERAMVPALRRGGCLVAFSGGSDSARVLACAVRVARAEGLDMPVPISMRARGELDVNDRGLGGRQEQIVRFLGIKDWERIELGDDLDYLGLAATRLLRRHGSVFPANVHAITPMLERARGATLIIGHAGRELFEFWRWRRVCDMLAGRSRPNRVALRELMLIAAPRRLRAGRLRSEVEPPPTWLTKAALREFVEARADEIAGEPLFWSEAVTRARTKRCLHATWGSFAKLAVDYQVAVETPYDSPEFLGALARAGGRLGWGDREQFRRHFDDRILPRRETRKPELGAEPSGQEPSEDPFWGPQAMSFADGWDGRGLDAELVDADKVRAAWLAHHHQAALLLQAAWLESLQRLNPS